MENSRRMAAFALARWLATKDFPDTLLPEGPQRAFVQDLLYTTIRRLRPLRRILGEFVRTWPRGELEALLYIGAAQLLYMPDVPDFAAVNETVEAAKSCGGSVPKVVNGVLRNIIRGRDRISLGTELETFPNAIVKRWTARYGAADAERLAAWHNMPAETYLAYRDRFERLPRGRRVEDVEGYREGLFVVQDPATRVAVGMVGARPGERILDACAAPGGKTVQFAWNGAAVTACEVNPRRRRVLEANLARTGLADKVAVVGSLEEAAAKGPFDKVSVDAPCSNTGVFRRKPDARWNWSVEKLGELVKLQAGILDQAAEMLAPGGTLVYSTCSNEPEENVGQVEAFLARHPGFAFVASDESVPVVSGSDGAFAAAMTRNLV
ncbi:MAG: MFS transporter [Kiritimatiellae bacterium]|nr:MFS transporter [Kiritimatiellia bacterium]